MEGVALSWNQSRRDLNSHVEDIFGYLVISLEGPTQHSGSSGDPDTWCGKFMTVFQSCFLKV